MRLDVSRVRQLCMLCHGCAAQGDAFDQKPWHMNESGNQTRKGLQCRGVAQVPEQVCVCSTRERWTGNTDVTPRAAPCAPFPGRDMMLKGGLGFERLVEEHLRTLCAGGDCGDARRVPLTTSDKASFRAAHVLDFLRRHLPRRTPETRWRILISDGYCPHHDAAVFDLAWSRGVFLLKHGGGTTGRATAEWLPHVLHDAARAGQRR